MEWTEIADYFGLTGTTIFILYLLWILKQKYLKTKCTEGTDGSYHLDISIAKEDYDFIKGNADLMKQLGELKSAVQARRQTSSNSSSPTAQNGPPAIGTDLQIA